MSKKLVCLFLLCSIFIRARAQEDTILFGASISLTGKYAVNGKNTLDGYELAIKQINEKGGIKVGDKTYKLAIKYYDDESSSARAAQLAERLINQDKIKYVLGPFSSDLTGAIMPILERHKIPMVEGNGADRSLFTKGYKYIFAVLNTSNTYFQEAIDVLAVEEKKLGKEPKDIKIGIAIENDSFSEDVRDGALEEAKKFGMKIVFVDKFPPDISDMSSTIAKVKALKPDLLLVSGHAKGAALAIRQMSEQKAYVPMMALSNCDSAQIIEKFGKDANYAVCTAQWDKNLTYKDELFGSALNYAELFKKMFKYEPSYNSAQGSAALITFADAFVRAKSLDPEKVRNALAETDIMTFYGPIKFDSTGKNIAKSMVLLQVQNQEYKLIAPLKWATSKIIFPAPPWSER